MNCVILFSGKAESGKTLAANIFKEYLEKLGYRVAIIPYASYLKETAKLIFNWDGKKDAKGREILQRWGTEIVRQKDPDFWANSVRRLVDVVGDAIDYVLIDDVRFPNEIDIWKDTAHMTVRIERPGHENILTKEQRNHISETALDTYPFDLVFSGTNRNELERAIYDQMKNYKSNFGGLKNGTQV